MVLSPILIIGKEVPHRTPATMVRKTAFPFLLNKGLGNGWSPCPSNRQVTSIKHFCSKYQRITYWTPNYIQHNPMIEKGRNPFGKVMQFCRLKGVHLGKPQMATHPPTVPSNYQVWMYGKYTRAPSKTTGLATKPTTKNEFATAADIIRIKKQKMSNTGTSWILTPCSNK
jgi:hypothetical protein